MSPDIPEVSRRQVAKEWGEAVEIWCRIVIRLGFLFLGMFNGGAVIKIVQDALT